jgi:transcriptional regulator with XRE-family HTH domain
MPGRRSPAVNKSKIALAIGKRIYAHRKALGLTQEQFAEKVDLSKNYIGNVERGEYEVSISVLVRIGAVLGTDASSLLKEAGL